MLIERGEPRHLFMATAVLLVIFSPLLVVFVPAFIIETLHFSRDYWVLYSPSINFLLTGIALVLVIIACVIFFFFTKLKIGWISGLFLMLVGGVLLYIVSQSYIAIGDEGTNYSSAFSEKQHILWEDINKIENIKMHDAQGEYVFNLKNESKIKIVRNGMFDGEVESKIYRRAMSEGIDFKEFWEDLQANAQESK